MQRAHWCERPLNATWYPTQVSKGVGCGQWHPIPLNTCLFASLLHQTPSLSAHWAASRRWPATLWTRTRTATRRRKKAPSSSAARAADPSPACRRRIAAATRRTRRPGPMAWGSTGKVRHSRSCTTHTHWLSHRRSLYCAYEKHTFPASWLWSPLGIQLQ